MKLRSILFPPPVSARHYKRTMLFSPDDDCSQPTRKLIDTAVKAIKKASTVDLEDVSGRMQAPPYWPNQWPGEHYRLLAAFVAELQPAQVIEIGTERGLSALSMKKFLPEHSRLTTFDLISWDQFSDSCLEQSDFADGRLVQEKADLSDPDTFSKYTDLLEKTEFFFVDGPKDRKFEPRFWDNLRRVKFRKPAHIVFDDTKDWNMLAFWRNITAPKIDLTSFGH